MVHAEGKVVESIVDQGRGIVSTVMGQRGLLIVGESFFAGFQKQLFAGLSFLPAVSGILYRALYNHKFYQEKFQPFFLLYYQEIQP